MSSDFHELFIMDNYCNCKCVIMVYAGICVYDIVERLWFWSIQAIRRITFASWEQRWSVSGAEKQQGTRQICLGRLFWQTNWSLHDQFICKNFLKFVFYVIVWIVCLIFRIWFHYLLFEWLFAIILPYIQDLNKYLEFCGPALFTQGDALLLLLFIIFLFFH